MRLAGGVSGWPPTSSSNGRKPCDRRRCAKAGGSGVAELGDDLGQLAGEALVADERLRLGVADDVGDLGADEVVVDRRDVAADLGAGEVGGEHLDAVGQHEGEGVVGLHARCAWRPLAIRLASGVELAGREDRAVGGDEDLPVGVGGGEAEEAGICTSNRQTRTRSRFCSSVRPPWLTDDDVLTAPLVIEYPFSRTTGPVVGAFLTGLREGSSWASRGPTGGCSCRPPSTTR